MKIYCYGCERMYGGLHGTYTHYVTEVDDSWSLDRCYQEFIPELSYDVMNNYHEIYESIYEEALQVADDPENEEEVYGIVENTMAENIDGFVCKIRDDVTLSVEELDKLCRELGREFFKRKYCVDF